MSASDDLETQRMLTNWVSYLSVPKLAFIGEGIKISRINYLIIIILEFVLL